MQQPRCYTCFLLRQRFDDEPMTALGEEAEAILDDIKSSLEREGQRTIPVSDREFRQDMAEACHVLIGERCNSNNPRCLTGVPREIADHWLERNGNDHTRVIVTWTKDFSTIELILLRPCVVS